MFEKILKTEFLETSKILIIVRTFNCHRKITFLIKISMGIFVKYIVVIVIAKISMKFKGITTEISKNRSKFTKRNIFYLLGFLVHKSFSTVWLIIRFYRECLATFKMLSFVKIGDMQNFC